MRLGTAREVNEKLNGELHSSRKRYEADVTYEQFIGRLHGMTEGDLHQMAERLNEPALGQARRRVAEYHALAIGEWTA